VKRRKKEFGMSGNLNKIYHHAIIMPYHLKSIIYSSAIYVLKKATHTISSQFLFEIFQNQSFK